MAWVSSIVWLVAAGIPAPSLQQQYLAHTHTYTHTIWMTLLCCWLSATFQHKNHYNYDCQCGNDHKCHSYYHNSSYYSCCVVRLSTCRGNTLWTCRGNTLCLANIRCCSWKKAAIIELRYTLHTHPWRK